MQSVVIILNSTYNVNIYERVLKINFCLAVRSHTRSSEPSTTPAEADSFPLLGKTLPNIYNVMTYCNAHKVVVEV